MKSEHRHELQRNELKNLADQMTPFFEENGSKILMGLIAIVLVIAGVYWWQGSSGEAETAAWTGLLTAESAEDFANVAEQFPGTAPAAWAQLNEATTHLRDGTRLSFVNREGAETDLRLAKEKLTDLVEKKDLPRELRVRALYALARCLETTSGGDVGPAIEAYKKIITEFDDPIYSVYRENATKAIETLEEGSTQEFYAWYAKQNPKPTDRPRPRDGMFPGINPGDLELPTTLPSVPEMLQGPVEELRKQSNDEGNATPSPPAAGDGESTDETGEAETPSGAADDSSAPRSPALPEDGDAPSDDATDAPANESSDAAPTEK